MVGLSLRAFARLRRVSLFSVQCAIRDGRLTASVGHDLRGRPVIRDPALAMEEWEAHSRPRLISAHRGNGNGRGSPSALARATVREREARARTLEAALARQLGEVISVRDVELSWAAQIVATRTALLGLPSRARARLPHLSAADVGVLDGLVREVLTELAQTPTAPEPGVVDRPRSKSKCARRRARASECFLIPA